MSYIGLAIDGPKKGDVISALEKIIRVPVLMGDADDISVDWSTIDEKPDAIEEAKYVNVVFTFYDEDGNTYLNQGYWIEYSPKLTNDAVMRIRVLEILNELVTQ